MKDKQVFVWQTDGLRQNFFSPKIQFLNDLY